MKCCVENCNNDSSKVTKADGIIFHSFPKNKYFRTAWLEALGLTDWDPDDRSVVCSEHFSSDASSSASKRTIGSDAAVISMQMANSLDASAALRACRVCLATTNKLYDLKDGSLYQAYLQVMCVSISEEDKLPQKLCWECAGRLRHCARFKAKALRSQALMMEALLTSPYLSMKHVKTIKSSTPELNSSLKRKHFKPNEFNLQINDSQVSVKSEDDKADLHDDDDDDDDYDFDDRLPLASNDEIKDSKVEKGDEQIDDELPRIPIVEVEIKGEKIDDFFLEENANEDDIDDSNLNEPIKKRVKRDKKPRVQRSKKTEKKEKVKSKKTKTKTKVEKKKDTKTTSETKQREREKRTPEEPLDESLFTITKLSFEDQIAEVEKRQETNSYKTSPFKCTICYRGYFAKERYDIHMVKHSEIIGALQCFICKFRMKSARALRKHIYGQHTYNFQCNKCPYVTKTRCIAREHQKWHTGAKYQCPRCPRNFGKYTSYMGHLRIKHATDFVCELCGFTFVSEKGIEVHKKAKHRLHDKNTPLEGPYCEVCDVRFISDEAHTRHLKVSSKHITEDDPNRLHNDSVSMKIERTRRRPGEASELVTHTCEECGIQLSGLRAYNQHYKKDHPDKYRTSCPPSAKPPCMCEQCGKIFTNMNSLIAHKYVHTGEKPFKCSQCEKAFTHKVTLTIHKRTHSDTPPSYECPICGRHFTEPNNRRRHMRIHTGEKPYKCDYCEKCFTSSSEKRAHVDHVHLKKPWPKRDRARRSEWRDRSQSETDDWSVQTAKQSV